MSERSPYGAQRGAPRKVTREQVFDAATIEINRRGVLSTLIKDVAAALGVTRMTIYQHIEDREDLVYCCYLRTCDQLDAQINAARRLKANPIEKFRTLLRHLVGPDAVEMCAIVESGLLPEDKRKKVESRFDAVVRALAKLLEEGAATGDMRTCAFDVVARAIINTTFWAPLANLWNRTEILRSRNTVLEVAETLLLDGWSADRSSPVEYEPIDLQPLVASVSDAFDRTSLSDTKRERILSIASRQFNRKGVDSTTLDDIAQELGATPRALYHHVGDKETLVAECYFRMMRMAIYLQKAAYRRNELKLVSNTAFQHAWALTQMRSDLSPLMPLTGFSTLRADHQQRFHDYGVELTNVTLAHLRAGGVDGSIRPLGRYALRLQGGVLGWLARSTYAPNKHDMIARETATLLAKGIRATDSGRSS